MRSRRYPHLRPTPSSAFAGYRFPPEVINLAVRWYLRFGLSYRDVEELLAERGIEVDHVSIYRWSSDSRRSSRRPPGLDSTLSGIAGTSMRPTSRSGTWCYLFRGNRPVRPGHRRVPLTPAEHPSRTAVPRSGDRPGLGSHRWRSPPTGTGSTPA